MENKNKLFTWLLVITIFFAIFNPLWSELSLFTSMVMLNNPAISKLEAYSFIFIMRLPILLAIPLLVPAWYLYAKERFKKAWLLTVISYALLVVLIIYFCIEIFRGLVIR